jgi:5-methylcytosine-specific restriction endonuclease McrA
MDYEELGIERLAIYDMDDIMPLIGKHDKVSFETKRGKFVARLNSLKLRVFKEKGHKCVACPLTGSHFVLERLSNTPPGIAYLNLYAPSGNNNLTLMTRDHIIPVSKGGKDTMENSQTMCFPCNLEKGNGNSI